MTFSSSIRVLPPASEKWHYEICGMKREDENTGWAFT